MSQLRTPNIWECVYGAAYSVLRWTDAPAREGEKGIWRRNWRSWFGHATVATSTVAFSRWFGLHMGFLLPPLAVWIPLVVLFSLIVFYFIREFGPGGDFWNEDIDKEDSVIDFWIVLLFATTAYMIPLVYSVLLGFVMIVSIYLLSIADGERK